MTKAERIRELTEKYPHLTSGEISERLGCNDAYVRAVWQRMKGGGKSAADRAYEERYRIEHGRSPSTVCRERRFRRNPNLKAKWLEQIARWKANNPEKQRGYERTSRARKKAERDASHA